VVTWTVTDGSGNLQYVLQKCSVVTDIDFHYLMSTSSCCKYRRRFMYASSFCFRQKAQQSKNTVSVASVYQRCSCNFPIGETTVVVTWTVTDGSGNIAICTHKLVVTTLNLPMSYVNQLLLVNTEPPC
jgi:hypothetical protein